MRARATDEAVLLINGVGASLDGLSQYFRRPVIPNAAVRWILSFSLHDQCTYAGGRPNASVATRTS
jgi:hypothetical protein